MPYYKRPSVRVVNPTPAEHITALWYAQIDRNRALDAERGHKGSRRCEPRLHVIEGTKP